MKQAPPSKWIFLIVFVQFVFVVVTLYYGIRESPEMSEYIESQNILSLEVITQKQEIDRLKAVQQFLEEKKKKFNNSSNSQSHPYSLFSKLSSNISRRIDMSQNPSTCSAETSLFCKIPDHCGFGCQGHAILHCLGHAVATNKSAILTGHWTYSTCGWNCYFKPFSKCQEFNFPMDIVHYDGTHETGILTELPPEIYDTLKPYHHDPALWYIGQLVKYMFRPQDDLLEKIKKKKAEINWDHPIVGIHVRRTDKVQGHAEASFHLLEEYMDRVEAYYLLHYTHLRKEQRRVFLASDEISLMEEARQKYPHFTFLTTSSAVSADLSRRYSDESLLGVIFDIFLLAETDFFIGTFSSQVSRFAYELMQTKHINGMNVGVTLMHDDGYYLGNSGKRMYEEEWLKKFVGIYLPDTEYTEIDYRLAKLRTSKS